MADIVKYMLGALILLSIVLILFVTFSEKARTVLKTGLLIVVTHPYEQDGGHEKVGSILVVGDSTAYGVGVWNSRYSVAGRLGADFPNYSIDNISKVGITTSELAELLHAKDLGTYDMVLVQVGGNDILQKRPLDDIEKGITAVFSEAKKISTNVIAMSNGNVGGARKFVEEGHINEAFEKRSREVRELFIAKAEQMNVHYVDLFEEPENDVFVQYPKKYSSFDGLHPSALGYGEWYKKLLPFVSL